MADKNVYENIVDTCEGLGEVDLGGIKLEGADRRLLDVSQMDLDTHIAMQPSAVAYYGTLYKDASRRLDAMTRTYKRWEKRKLAEARVSVENGSKAASSIKAADIEARFIVDNEAEIDKYEVQIDKLQREYDTLSMWYEAWKQKSFSIREFTSLTEDERFNSNASSRAGVNSSDRQSGVSRVRGIIKNRQSSGN